MIVVKLMGGLGNQLFQYAAGRALALKYHTPLKLDLSFLNADAGNQHTKRELELQAFRTNYTLSNETEVRKFINPSIFEKYFSGLFTKKRTVNQNDFGFDEKFFTYPENTYLNGFWQSEKYFIAIREILLKELVLKENLSKKCEEAKNLIFQSNSVSLHVRRGDYVSNKNASAHHGTLPLTYYSQALAYLNSKYKDLKVFVFSDDMDWVKANLVIENAVMYVDFNSAGVFDLYLMSLCKHNIIANSSFSWWGAWLNQNKDKTVIAPEKWFNDKTLDTKDLIPASWLRL